jgi:antibiotic biosynthesis monooxygenase (ABM) superfamily enzyme
VPGWGAWFSLPNAPQLPPPPKWKMAIATSIGAYIVTAIVIPLEMILVPHAWSFYETNIITNIIMGTAMTWAINAWHEPPAARLALRTS